MHAAHACSSSSAVQAVARLRMTGLWARLSTQVIYNTRRDLEDMKHVLLTNVVGTFAITKAFLPLLKQGSKKTIINMSSDAGCLTQNASFIHDNRPSDAGMALSYRASKVALNMGEFVPLARKDIQPAQCTIFA